MKVIEIEGGSGGPEAMRLTDRGTPVPGPGEIRIAVRAAGVNRPDLLQRRGLYPPPPGASDVMGLEIAGVIEAVGEGVDPARLGQAVCALLAGGGYAEQAVVDARHALPIPDGLDFIQAAALPETVFTVWANVFEAGALEAGETLLLHGGTSGIGVTAIQMARAAGARVVTTGRGAAKAEAARALGADVALDSTAPDYAEALERAGPADVILDMVGAETAAVNMKALAQRGRWVVIATQSGATAPIDLMRLMLKQGVLTGSTLRRRPADEKARLAQAILAAVWPWIADGKVRPPVAATYPLAHAGDAHRRLESGDVVGKIVLTL